MSEITFKEFPLNEIFRYISGNIEYNKTYCHLNSGIYPVFTATIKEPIGCINIYEYDGKYLSWTVDGVNSGTVEILNGKFNTGNGRGILEPLIDGLNLEYVRHVLQPICKREAEGRGRGGTPHCKWSHIYNKVIQLPVKDNGSVDYEYQKKLAEKYDEVERQKNSLQLRISEIKDISVRLPMCTEISWKEVLAWELFKPQNGSSKYTKTWCKSHEGMYPLYSGNTDGEYEHIDEYQYDGEYLTWAKDGLAGYMMLHNGKFTLTGHRGILIPTDKCVDIDLKYIKYVLEPIFRANKKGREGDLGKNEYTTLNSDMIKKMKDTIPIPIKEDGSFDLDKQKELANKYEQIEIIKKELIDKIDELTNIVVS